MGHHTASFYAATEHRRTYYGLSPKSTVADSEIVKIAESALLHVPSAFNSESTRIAVLLGLNHTKLWEIVADALLHKIGEERFNAGTKARIAGFANAYGSILFFDDPGHTKSLKDNAGPLYSDKAEEWTHQSNGMHQYYVWTALETHGLGVNLQHYNPLIDDEVKKTFELPEHWILKAQMVFGTPIKDPAPKEQKVAMADRLIVRGAEA
jgi:predicted oxidoreductase (fatty acid repression mutant protein)